MAQIDIRQSLEIDLLCATLLSIAKEPLRYPPSDPPGFPQIYADFPDLYAANIARQASSAVTIMCAAHLWSQIVQHLQAVTKPSDNSKKAKGSNLARRFKMYFDICEIQYQDTPISKFVELLSDMRNALVHDGPEAAFDDSSQRVDEVVEWRSRLNEFLSNDEIEWLPRIRPGNPKSFRKGGEPAIGKFMKYSVAKMIYEHTNNTAKEISSMMFARIGQLNLAPEKNIEDFDERIRFDGPLFRLWQAGE